MRVFAFGFVVALLLLLLFLVGKCVLKAVPCRNRLRGQVQDILHGTGDSPCHNNNKYNEKVKKRAGEMDRS